MIIEMLDEYLETLAGYVYDNDKLVTYKWLSKELEVHVNVAKEILWEFWQKHKDNKNIECTIMLMGFLKDGGMRVEVVKETNVSTAKEKFSKIISEHLYSIQKSLPDIELLAISGEGDVKYSAIKCTECVERSNEELSMLRWGTNYDIHNQINPKEQVMVTEKHADSRVSSNIEPQSTKSAKNSSNPKNNFTAKKSGFNNLFSKAINKQKDTASSSDTNKIQNDLFVKNNSETKPFVSNKLVFPSDKLQKNDTNGSIDKNIEQAKCTNSLKNVEDKTISCNDKQKKSNETSHNKFSSKRGKKRNRSKEGSTMEKKRKRIIVDNDSSDTGSNSDINEAELPSSPEGTSNSEVMSVKQQSPPPQIKQEGGKRKILKIVDKTFEDNGYLVTKKVHVYQSCSEDELDDMEAKESKKSESPKETKIKKNTKQTTLMSFFKKS